MSDRRPAALLFAAVVAVLQVVAAAVFAVLGLLEAAAATAGDHAAAARGDEPNPWSGFGAAVGTAVALAGLVTVVLIGVPLLVLRGGSRTRRVTGRGLLIGAELLLLLPLVVFFHVRLGSVFALGTDPVSLVLDLLLLVPIVVIAGLLVPSTGRWAMSETLRP